MTEKACTGCGEMKPLEMFAKDYRNPSRTITRCKVCKSNQGKRWAKEHREHLNELSRNRWVANTRIREKAKARTYQWRDRHPVKHSELKKAQCERKRARDHGMTVEEYRSYLAAKEPIRLPGRVYVDGMIVKKNVKRTCPLLSAFPKIEYQVNRLEHLAKARAWHKAHPDKAYAKKLRRKMRLAGVVDTLTLEQWEGIKQRFNYCCAYCGKRKKLTRDHVIPISKGGPNSVDNIVPACISCNCSKHTGPPPVPVQTMMFA